MSSDLIVRPFTVQVQGFSSGFYVARSRGQALSKAWSDYRAGYNECTFGDFLKIARARLSDGHPKFGRQIEVAGLPAYFVGESGQYVRFVRPNSDQVLLSHPLDVKDPS